MSSCSVTVPPAVSRDFATPLFLYDLRVVRQRGAELRATLPPGSTLLYSLKANPLPPLVAAVQAAGCGSEVSSLSELAVAVGGVGGSSLPVLYTGPGKSSEEIAAAVRAGAVLSCESEVELARVAATVEAGERPATVVLRLQPPSRPAAGLSMADGKQFGFDEREAVEACRRRPPEVDILGFHCYLGSQLPTHELLLAGFAEAVAVIGRVADAGGVQPRVADVGGGFPWPYAAPGAGPDLSPLGDDLARVVEPLRAQGAEVWFESGRRLVAAAGRLLTTVMDVKRRDGKTIVVVDAGVNVLGGMSGLGRVLRPSTVLGNVTSPEGDEVSVDVVGPLCTPLDRLAVATMLAAPHVGDVLCIDNVGAYAPTAALAAFLLRPPALEVVTDGDDVLEVWVLEHRHVRAAYDPGRAAVSGDAEPAGPWRP